jgi:group II intron reverse transcriptase/maturase
MQNAEVILSILSQKSAQNSAYVFDRLYRNLFNPDFYRLASSHIDAREGPMPAGVDAEAMPGFSAPGVEEIIAQLKQETYYPQAVTRASVPRALSSWRDELVQEIVRLLLQAIYEPVFKDTSHGFRPGRSCHTALLQLKKACKGTHWVIEGDITGVYDHMDHSTLLALLSRKVSDGRLLNLISRLLKAGYLACWQEHSALTGTPRGGIVSPILANIYLHELDVFMEQLCNQLTAQGVTGATGPAYQEFNLERLCASKHGEESQAGAVLTHTSASPSARPLHMNNGQQVRYIRYADDFVVMIVGGKQLALQIREVMRDFLQQELGLELNLEKTLITNLADRRVRFLGYEVVRARGQTPAGGESRGAHRPASGGAIHLLVPGDVIRESLKPFVKHGKAIHHNARLHVPLLDLLAQYNAEIRGLYDYYSLATDVSKKLGMFRYYHYSSLLKTVARKEQCSVAQVLGKHGVDVKQKQKTGTRRIFGVSYQTKAGPRTLTYFNESIRKRDEPAPGNVARGVLEIGAAGSRQARSAAGVCELCGRGVQEHGTLAGWQSGTREPVRRAALVPLWVQPSGSLRGKTLVVCQACAGPIHSDQSSGRRTTVRAET